VPGAGLAGICGVDSGNAAPLVGGPPGVELHAVIDALPSGDVGTIVPIVLPTLGVEMVPNGEAGVIDGIAVAGLPAVDVETVLVAIDGGSMDATVMEGGGRARGGNAGDCGAGTVEPGMVDRKDVAGCADSARNGAAPPTVVDVEEVAVVGDAAIDGVVAMVMPIADIEVTGTAAVEGPIWPVGVEQVTTVPGVVGSEASGTGASVVSGTPGWVAAENGPGPLSGEDTIVPGVDERPMAVVPMVETCARLAWPPNTNAVAVNSRRRMAMAPSAPD